jgi:hypothetical protein
MLQLLPKASMLTGREVSEMGASSARSSPISTGADSSFGRSSACEDTGMLPDSCSLSDTQIAEAASSSGASS